jgi:hypothetical protein
VDVDVNDDWDWLDEIRDQALRAPIPCIDNPELTVPADEHLHLQVQAAELAKRMRAGLGENAPALALAALEMAYAGGRQYGRMEERLEQPKG